MNKQQFMYHNIQIKGLKLDCKDSIWIKDTLSNILKDLFCITKDDKELEFSITSKNNTFHTKILDTIYSPLKSMIKVKDEDLYKYIEKIYDRNHGEPVNGEVRNDDVLTLITKYYFDAYRETFLANDLFTAIGVGLAEGILVNDKIKVLIYVSTEFDDDKRNRKVDRFVFTIYKDKIERTVTSFKVRKSKDLNSILK